MPRLPVLRRRSLWLLALTLVACARPAVPATAEAPPPTVEPATPTPPRLAELVFPAPYADVAREVIDLRGWIAPSILAEAGLLDDAVRVPSFTPQAVTALDARAQAALDALTAPTLGDPTIDATIDRRWLQANAALTLHQLRVERRWEHRPAEWLETTAYTLIAHATMAPERPELIDDLAALLPGMVAEMEAVCTAPTRRDVTTAVELIEGIVALLEAADSATRQEAIAALEAYATALESSEVERQDYRVIGAEAYAWRLEHAMLLPWTPDELLALAERDLAEVQAAMEALPERAPHEPDAELLVQVETFDQAAFLATYDDAVAQNLATLRTLDLVTIPDDLPPMRARETPAAIVPLSGNGGSMNPPPLFGPARVGWWNVERYEPDWTVEKRTAILLRSAQQRTHWFGPYAVHEGVPGHHLQLSLARRIANPIRTILTDFSSVEGWGLYAEQLFWEHGGMGETTDAEWYMLRSYRGRIRRIFYDVNAEMERWTLQEAAEWRAGQEGVEVDRDVLRAIQWPTQLIGYYAGKRQILDLREEVRAQQGEAYSERAFHDALLAEGLIPLSLVREKLLGSPVEP